MNLFEEFSAPMMENQNTDWSKIDLEQAVDKNKYTQENIARRRYFLQDFVDQMKIKIPDELLFECFLWNKPYSYETGKKTKTIRKWFMVKYIDDIIWEIGYIIKNYIRDEKMIKLLPVLPIGMISDGVICCNSNGLIYIFNGKELYPMEELNDTLLESVYFTEADDDPPEVDPPTADETTPTDDGGADTSTDNGSTPPDIGDLSSPDMGADDGGTGEYQDDGTGEGGEGSAEETDPNDLPLDEKGEIFAKVEILKSYRYLYKRISDTISTIDKIDIVQIGNSISSEEVSELKRDFSVLQEDVYATIVFEFSQQYSNLKVKLIAYSAKYVHLVKQLVAMIKKDQRL